MTSDDGLARVTYLPGVFPPTSGDPGSEPSPETSSDSARDRRLSRSAAAAPPPVGHTPAEPTADEPSAEERSLQAEKISMRALTRKGQSRWQLEKKLLAHDLDAQTVDAELDRLERVGLVDDAELASTLVRTLHERKGLGRAALQAELRQRHIDQHIIEAALGPLDDEDEQARAIELAQRRASQLRSLDHDTAVRRLSGYLMRKGYAGSVVRVAVDRALGSRDARPSTVRFR